MKSDWPCKPLSHRGPQHAGLETPVLRMLGRAGIASVSVEAPAWPGFPTHRPQAPRMEALAGTQHLQGRAPGWRGSWRGLSGLPFPCTGRDTQGPRGVNPTLHSRQAVSFLSRACVLCAPLNHELMAFSSSTWRADLSGRDMLAEAVSQNPLSLTPHEAPGGIRSQPEAGYVSASQPEPTSAQTPSSSRFLPLHWLQWQTSS